MIETLLGGLFGGLFRIAPEVFKVFDAKNQREHELKMLQAEMDFAKIKAEAQMKETQANLTVAELNAMQEAFKQDAATAASSYKWVAAISALVRPAITYWVVGLYSAVKIASIVLAVEQGGAWLEVIKSAWSADDMAFLNLIVTFWFVGRVYERK